MCENQFCNKQKQSPQRYPSIKQVQNACKNSTEAHSLRLIITYTEITVLHSCSPSDLLYVSKNTCLRDTLQEMLVCKIIVKIVLKIYRENPPRRDYQLQYMSGICVIFSTLKVLISLKKTSLMIASIKMHEKDTWRIANSSADLYNSREILMHFVMKIIEVDSCSRRKLTQNQELSMKVIFL